MIRLDEQQIRDYLEAQGLGAISKSLAVIILQNCLRWSVSAPPDEPVDALVAFAFGNRIDKVGNRTPGPVNEQLADIVENLYKQHKCTVIAQWEIAHFLLHKIPEKKLVSIHPQFDPVSDRVIYLSTRGVLDKARDHLAKTACIYIVAHRDHLVRCLQTASEMGLQAFSESLKMPVEYDPFSSQAWTRNREAYLVSDMISRLSAVRDVLMESG